MLVLQSNGIPIRSWKVSLLIVMTLFLQILHSLLQKLAESIIIYVRYQADSGAQAVQIFDSWATQLSPVDFEVFSLPYIKQIVTAVKSTHPDLPLILYASGSGGLLERMASTGVDVMSIDWTVDMADARQRIGTNLAVQVHFSVLPLFANVDEFNGIYNMWLCSRCAFRLIAILERTSYLGFLSSCKKLYSCTRTLYGAMSSCFGSSYIRPSQIHALLLGGLPLCLQE